MSSLWIRFKLVKGIIKMTCKCQTFRITNCDHCGFPRYGYNKWDYYQLACEYYIASDLTLGEIAIKFNLKYQRLSKHWLFVKKYNKFPHFRRRRKLK